MNTIAMKEGTDIDHKGWGPVQSAVFSHGTTRVAKFVMVCAATPLAETVTRRKRR